MSDTKIILCGSIAVDRIMNFSGRYRDLIKPDKLHVLSISTLLDQLETSRGGIGANIASGLALLGESPILLGSVGHDADDYIKELAGKGIDVSNVHFSDLATASFNVITDSEDSQIGGFYRGAMSDSASVSFLPWQGQDILAVISAHDPVAMNRQVEECKSANIRFVYDPGQQVSDQATDLTAGASGAEVVFVNDYELSVLSERTGLSSDELYSQVPVFITTLGKDGSVITGQNQSHPLRIGIAKPSAVLDPTGAGDAYRAGFLYGYLRQWDLQLCGQLGATLASLIIEKHGTQHNFTKDEILTRYRDNFKEEIEL